MWFFFKVFTSGINLNVKNLKIIAMKLHLQVTISNRTSLFYSNVEDTPEVYFLIEIS